MPRPLNQSMIDAIVHGYGDAARRMQTAGLDGVEIVASHGYLPAQFLNPRVNLRDDAYGGELDGRLRFPARGDRRHPAPRCRTASWWGCEFQVPKPTNRGSTRMRPSKRWPVSMTASNYVHITVGYVRQPSEVPIHHRAAPWP